MEASDPRMLQPDQAQAALVQAHLRNAKEQGGAPNASQAQKQKVAEHLARLRAQGLLKDVSSDLGFYRPQAAREVDDTTVGAPTPHCTM